jgi:hypothetical protein
MIKLKVTRIPMGSVEKLRQQLASVEAQLECIKSAGDYLVGVRIERSPAGGSASQSAKETCKYARLRAGKGKLLPNGKKSLYIPVAQIATYEAACDRGAQVQRLEKERNAINAQIEKAGQPRYRSLKDGKPKRFQQKDSTLSEHAAVPVIEVMPPPPPIAPAAILVLYRQSAHTPVHAVAAEVWQGEHKLAEVRAIHCMGMKADKVTVYIKELLLSLHQQFGMTRFENVTKEIPVDGCPIVPCPLKHS